ncbi:TPA: DUF551 domain-containing protein [Salmonella enterica]
MTTITRERAQEIFLGNGPEPTASEQRELARIALASLTAKPIAHTSQYGIDRMIRDNAELLVQAHGGNAYEIPLYTTPPAPIVPEKLPCSVELKPGLIIGKGCKTETLLTALRRRADYYAKIDAFTPEERAEHDASIEAFKAMLPTPADSQGRPRAPVVPPAIEPDYKVIKSILPTANPDEYACCIAADMWNACRATMLQDNQRDLSQPVDPQVAEYEQIMLQAGNSPVIPDGWISCSERMPVIGELNWRTSLPLLITCEIGVIPAYYGFVSVNGDKHYGFMESFKYGDGRGNLPQTNEYGLISNVTHWMPLPEPPQEVNRG